MYLSMYLSTFTVLKFKVLSTCTCKYFSVCTYGKVLKYVSGTYEWMLQIEFNWIIWYLGTWVFVTTNDFEFLAEWLSIMSHIAAALDKVQCESTTESYFDAILPCVFAVQRTLDCSSPKHCGSLVGALKNGLPKRFGDFMSIDHFGENNKSKTAITAAVTHPLLSWCGCSPILRWRKSLKAYSFVSCTILSQCKMKLLPMTDI